METLEITLERHTYTPINILGTIRIGSASWATLEDAARKVKVMEKTAIPAGRYQVVPYVFFSKYEIRPLLKDVPNFNGIFLHVGNTDLDTKGCPLIGKNYGQFGRLVNSRVAYGEFCAHLCDAWADKKDVWLTIKDQENHPWFDEVA